PLGWLLPYLLKEPFRHSHAGQVSFNTFRQSRVFLFGAIADLLEVQALEPDLFRRGRSPHACCQDKHTSAYALPVIVYRGQSPLVSDFLAQLHRRKHIPARGVKEHRQFVNVWADGPNQLNRLARQGSVDRALIPRRRRAQHGPSCKYWQCRRFVGRSVIARPRQREVPSPSGTPRITSSFYESPACTIPSCHLLSLPRIAKAIVTLPLATATPQLYWKLAYLPQTRLRQFR